MSSLSGYVDSISHTGVSGWAADLERPNEPIEVVIFIDDREIGRVVADRPRADLVRLHDFGDGLHGFDFRFPEQLQDNADRYVAVRFSGTDSLLPNGFQLLRAPGGADLPSASFVADDQRTLQPLLVSSAGRSGSTILMKLLLGNPQITGGSEYPFELRVGAYFANAHRVLTLSADAYGHELRETFDAQKEVISVNPFHHYAFHRVTADPTFLRRFFERDVRDQLSKTFRVVIESFYAALAADQSRPTACYFVEKSDVTRLSREAIRTLYGSVKELLLVRDLRDVVCSFRRFFANGSEATVIDHLTGVAAVLCRTAETIDRDTLVIKYETLITNRTAVLSDIERFLGVPSTWEFDNKSEAVLHSRHGTSQSPELSIGRWKEELTREEQDLCRINFGTFLKAFGYDD